MITTTDIKNNIKKQYNKLKANKSFLNTCPNLKLILVHLDDIKTDGEGYHNQLSDRIFANAGAELVHLAACLREYAEIYELLDEQDYMDVEDMLNKISTMDPNQEISNF